MGGSVGDIVRIAIVATATYFAPVGTGFIALLVKHVYDLFSAT